jgi:hypothetical protein
MEKIKKFVFSVNLLHKKHHLINVNLFFREYQNLVMEF